MRAPILFSILLLVLLSAGFSLSQRTVEFFVGQANNSLASTTRTDFVFDFNLSESGLSAGEGFVEIVGVADGVADITFTLTLNGSNSIAYAFDSALAESHTFTLRYPVRVASLVAGRNGPFNLSVTNTGSAVTLLSARLVLTYTFDSSSLRVVKTARYWVGLQNSSLASNAEVSLAGTFSLPESNAFVLNAFVEWEGVSAGAATDFLIVDLNSSGAKRHQLVSTGVTQAFSVFYNASSLFGFGSGNHPFAASLNTSGAISSIVGAVLVVTYVSDSRSPSLLETARYFVGTNATTVASGARIPLSFSFKLPETGASVLSAFFRVTGWGSGTDTSNGSLDVDGAGVVRFVTDITTEGNDFTILYNASPAIYSAAQGNNGPFVLIVGLTGPTTSLLSAEFVVTYNYSNSSVERQTSVEYLVGQDDTQRVGAVTFPLVGHVFLAENLSNTLSSWLEVSEGTSAVAANTLTVMTDGQTVAYAKGNSGEPTFGVIRQNQSGAYPGASGANGPFVVDLKDSAIASLWSAKIITTYNYSFNITPAAAPTCILSLNASTLVFGSLKTQQYSANQTIQISNTGDAAADVLVNASNWVGNGYNFGAGNTSALGGDFASWTNLRTTQQTFKTALGGGSNFNGNFSVFIPAGQQIATYDQTVTVAISC